MAKPKKAAAKKAPAKKAPAKKASNIVGHVTRKASRMYYVDGKGDVREATMNRKGRPKGAKGKCA